MADSTGTKSPEPAAPAATGATPAGEPQVKPLEAAPREVKSGTVESPAPTGGGGSGTGGGPFGGNGFIFLMVGLLVVFYFMIMHPQRKREKARQEMLGKLKSGDRVVTVSGIVGEIVEISEQDAQIRIDARKDVRMRVRRAAIAGLAGDSASEEAAKDGGGQAG